MEAPGHLPQELAEALIEVGEAAESARRPWWIIGSAAAALHGTAVPSVGDVDVLMGKEDAVGLLAGRGLRPLPADDNPLFASEVFGRWRSRSGLPVEVMGGLRLRTANGLVPVRVEGREELGLGAFPLFVPPRRELVALLRRFGRDQDLDLARRLEAAR